MTTEPLSKTAQPPERRSRWSAAAESLSRPYRVSLPMVVLVSLVPLYIFIPEMVAGREIHTPELQLDRLVPLKPAWAIVYGALYLFLIVLPVLIVREEEHIRRTVASYLMVWITAYGCFVLYPTIAPRPLEIVEAGFGAWGLRILYGADTPYNCFPSLHVAHSFVSALTCYRLDRRLGVTTIGAAVLVALSTLFTKQHYVLDIAGGVALAAVAYALCFHGYRREAVPESHRSTAATIAAGLMAVLALVVLCFWLAYKSSAGQPS